MRSLHTAVGLMAVGLTTTAFAGDFLSIGDEAPAIDISHWVKGETIQSFEKEKIYVVEFWATWCGPCIASMPHLSEIQEKYADYDVTVVSVSDEPLQKVVSFLFKEYQRDGKIHNDRTHYTLTTDPDRSVFNDYMVAGGHGGIPTAFIVGRTGHIEWIGHPARMDDAIDGVAHDTWDRDAFKDEYEAQMKPRWTQYASRNAMNKAMAAGDWDTVLDLMDKNINAAPDNNNLKMQKFTTILTKMKDSDRAYSYGEDVIRAGWDDSQLLNAIAWYVVDNGDVPHRNIAFATKAANRAMELTNGEDAAILDTVARCHYEAGDLDRAIKFQMKAVKHAPEGAMGEGIQEALDKYLKAAGRN